jgi:hypothetical protein
MKIINIGQGVPENTTHCFILEVQKEKVLIYETFDYNVSKSLKATLNILRWNNIKESIMYRISKFISENNYKKNRFVTGTNYINSQLGKEIALLFWGIEATENVKEIQATIKNWNGLDPIERCYLYTMTNANLSIDMNRGWRGAIKKILIEN